MSKTELITVISENSDGSGSKLLDFMERYGLSSLAAATVEQLEEYVNGEFFICTGGCLRNYAEPLPHCAGCSLSAFKLKEVTA